MALVATTSSRNVCSFREIKHSGNRINRWFDEALMAKDQIILRSFSCLKAMEHRLRENDLFNLPRLHCTPSPDRPEWRSSQSTDENTEFWANERAIKLKLDVSFKNEINKNTLLAISMFISNRLSSSPAFETNSNNSKMQFSSSSVQGQILFVPGSDPFTWIMASDGCTAGFLSWIAAIASLVFPITSLWKMKVT